MFKDERCGYCGKPLEPVPAGGIYSPFRGGPTYHGADCWPRAFFEMTGEPFIECRICGKAEAGQWVKDKAVRLMEKQLCFHCEFWDDWAERDETDKLSVRINGHHFHLGDEHSKSGFRGFGGREFHIRFFDGHEVTSTNLWSQGDIPEAFRDRLPDNAEWVKS